MKNILILFLFLSSYSINAQWITRDTLPFALQEAPCVVLNNKIYIVGGISATFATLQTMEIYDPATDSWTTGVDLPAPRHHHVMCTLNNKIYVMGGYFDLQFIATNTVYMYDPDSLMWYVKTPMPFAAAAGDATAYNGKIYFIGGIDGSTLNICLEYNPLSDTWTQKSNMPTIREHLCVVSVDSLIYAIAGRGAFGAETTVEIYDPVNDQWMAAPDLTTGRSGCDAAVVNGKIYVLGGEGWGLVFDENEMFDPANQTWHSLDTMPHARHGLGVVAISDTIYTIGGATIAGYGACNLNEAFVVDNISSVYEPINTLKEIFAFPNPVTDVLHVMNCVRYEGENLFLYDLYGKLILENPIVTSNFKLQIKSFNSGIYFLRIGDTMRKIVKM